NAGTLQAGGADVFSPNSSYNVATGAALDLHGFDQSIGGLAGAGPVINDPAPLPMLTIVSGGTFAPGNGTAGSSMSVAANLAFQSGALYLVQANFVLTNGNISRQYTILTAAGGVSGTFGALVGANFPTALAPNLSYDANDVFLNLALNYNALGSLNTNQHNVAS